MVRAYDPGRPVPPELVDRLLDAARRAPSAGNSQGWHFVVLEGPEQTERFWSATLPPARRPGFRFHRLVEAPVVVLPLADPGAYTERYAEPDKAATGLADARRWPVPYWEIDTAFAVMLLLLAAHDEGLGTLFFGVFHGEAAVRAAHGIPERLVLLGAVTVGWPAPDQPVGRSADRPRRSLADITHRGRW